MIHVGFGTGRRLISLALILAITACTSQRPRPEAPTTAQVSETALPAQADQAAQQPLAEQTVDVAARSSWERLRARFAMGGCAYSDAVPREAQRYTRSPQHFSASWQKAMPAFLLVLKDIERRDLPGEFALLPYVESSYQALPAEDKGPAGIWQLMGRTAIDQGLRINRDFDQRLDLLASTDVALDLIERYDREFSDWRLVSMAFNAGEYRVKRALGTTPAATLDAQRIAKLKLTATTHQHLIRLLALSCIVSEPERFGVKLPTETADDLLEAVVPPAAIDLRLAASLAGLAATDVVEYNPEWAVQTNPHGPAARLLLPPTAIDHLNEALKGFPVDMLATWHSQRVDAARPLADLASTLGIAPHVLAAANRLEQSAQLKPGQYLLLPGAERATSLAEDRNNHIIKPGDTLSGIARYYQIRLADLLSWNGLSTRSILRPESALRIRAPSY